MLEKIYAQEAKEDTDEFIQKLEKAQKKMMSNIKLKLNKYFRGEINYLMEPDSERSYYKIKSQPKTRF